MRTRSKALKELAAKAAEHKIEHLAVLHGNAPDLDELLDLLDPIFPRDEIITGVVGPVIGTHAGPRVIGVSFQVGALTTPGRVLGGRYHLVEPIARGGIERGTIEIAPIAFMRGRTLNDSFVILDEAQNTTTEQMKMFLTRLGFGTKAVITGDVTQIDLPSGRTSGLVEAMKVVGNIEGISFVRFDDRDVVRHKLVQQIVKAYEAFSNGNGAARPGH